MSNHHDRLRRRLAPHIKEVGQSELARRTGIHQPTISAWVNGRRGLSIDRIDKLARGCGLRLKVELH